MSNDYGAKTLRLQALLKQGLSVPKPYAISSKKIASSTNSKGKWDSLSLKSIAKEAHQNLGASTYAVRSSALIEDGQSSSLAGQFKTRLNVPVEELSEAIQDITSFANQYLKGHLELFSILIQEYIEADFAGVAFTRNPLGGRELILEYHAGAGEAVVSGSITPQRIELYWDEMPPPALPELKKAIQSFKAIEKEAKHPQDIEWCIRKGKWFFLQARPITSVSAQAYKGLLYLDETLPSTPFYFSKTELSEIAPRPCPLTLDLLKRIYAKDGPVEKVYQGLGIHYEAHDFLRLVDGDLYVDRELELKTLLPAHSYFTNQALTPQWAQLKGAWTDFKNLLALSRLHFNWEALIEELIHALEEPMQTLGAEEALSHFLKRYELIFTINLGVDFAIKKNLTFPTIQRKLTVADKFLKGLQGNSLDLADESTFIRQEHSSAKTPTEQYARLREMGRWLTVKGIHQVRQALRKDKKNIRNEKSTHSFPKELSSFHPPRKLHYEGISPGQSSGILVEENDLKKAPKNTPLILYSPLLSPHLAIHFDKIAGIVSSQGGLLSHLAILAREYKIPVIVGFTPNETLSLGTKIQMDASKSTIHKEV